MLGLGITDDNQGRDRSILTNKVDVESYRSQVAEHSIGDSPRFQYSSPATSSKTSPSTLLSKLFHSSPTPNLSNSSLSVYSPSISQHDRPRSISPLASRRKGGNEEYDESPVIGTRLSPGRNVEDVNQWVIDSSLSSRGTRSSQLLDADLPLRRGTSLLIDSRGKYISIYPQIEAQRHPLITSAILGVDSNRLAREPRNYSLFTNPVSAGSSTSFELDVLHSIANSIARDGPTQNLRPRAKSFNPIPIATENSTSRRSVGRPPRPHHLSVPPVSAQIRSAPRSAPITREDQRRLQSAFSERDDFIELPVTGCQAYTFPHPRMKSIDPFTFDRQRLKSRGRVNDVSTISVVQEDEDDVSVRRMNEASRKEREKWSSEYKGRRLKKKTRDEGGYASDVSPSTRAPTRPRSNSTPHRRHRHLNINAPPDSPPVPHSFDALFRRRSSIGTLREKKRYSPDQNTRARSSEDLLIQKPLRTGMDRVPRRISPPPFLSPFRPSPSLDALYIRPSINQLTSTTNRPTSYRRLDRVKMDEDKNTNVLRRTRSISETSGSSAAKLSMELYRQLKAEEEERNQLVFARERMERENRKVDRPMKPTVVRLDHQYQHLAPIVPLPRLPSLRSAISSPTIRTLALKRTAAESTSDRVEPLEGTSFFQSMSRSSTLNIVKSDLKESRRESGDSVDSDLNLTNDLKDLFFSPPSSTRLSTSQNRVLPPRDASMSVYQSTPYAPPPIAIAQPTLSTSTHPAAN